MKKRNLFKNILITLLLTLSTNIAFADSAIMISPTEIKSVECKDNAMICFHVLSTLDNDKKSLIVTSQCNGSTNFTVKLKNKSCDYKVNITNGKMEIKGDSYMKILSIDLPPEFIEECTK